MPPSPTLVIFRGVCDVGVTFPSLLLSLDSLRLGLRGRRRRRFSDPDDSGELPREDGVGVRGPDLGGTPFPAGPSSILTGIAFPTGPQSPESFREASGPGPLLPSIASLHTHTQQTSHRLVEIPHEGYSHYHHPTLHQHAPCTDGRGGNGRSKSEYGSYTTTKYTLYTTRTPQHSTKNKGSPLAGVTANQVVRHEHRDCLTGPAIG